MSGIYEIRKGMTRQDLDDLAFEMFADTYPHEAAEMDWARFFALVQKRNPKVTEEVAKRLLRET